MSENISHFRIKKGDIEIEYFGTLKDVDSRYKEALDWVKSATMITPPKPSIPPVKPEEPRRLGQTGRGGRRSPIISKAIDEIISEGFLDEARTPSEVLEELERKTVPGVEINNVNEALKRKVKKGVLDRIKGSGKEYNYIKKVEKKT